jgi:hypothetical protein
MLIKDADVVFNDKWFVARVMSLWGFWCLAMDLSVVRYGCKEETSHANLSEIRELPCLVESLA